MSPSEYAAYKLYSANQYTGLGVSIDKDAETGGFKVLGVSSGSPAANAGIKGWAYHSCSRGEGHHQPDGGRRAQL